MAMKEERAQKKTQIIGAFQSNGDWRQVAHDLNVPNSTAYRWINEGESEDTRGGKRYQKISAEHRDFMINEVESNPLLTLSQLSCLIYEKFGFTISHQTVSRYLDSMSYTLKTVRFEPERANTMENKKKRKLFVEKLLQYQ